MPSWIETVVVLNLVSFGVVVFGLAARYLPLFEHSDPGRHTRQSVAGKPQPVAHVSP